MGDFIKKIDDLKTLIRETPPELIQERVYTCFANGCILLTAYLQTNGKPGWSSMLVDGEQPILNSKEQSSLEKTVANAPWLLDILKDPQPQKGGAIPAIDTHSILAKSIGETSLTGDDVSMDLMLEKFIQKTADMDTFWSNIKHSRLSAVTKLMNSDIYVPTPSGPIPVPVKPVVYFLIMLLDSFRLSQALMGNTNMPLTLIVLMEELVTGQWRQAILTAAGFISPSGVAAGVIAKYFVNAWVLINPEIRTLLIKDTFKGSKSLFIGFILWCATVLPPEFIRSQMQEAIEKVRGMVASFDEKVAQLEAKGSEALKPVGKKVEFKAIDLDNLKRISMEDIQNLQVLAQWPLLICTKEYQEIQGPLEKDPFFRLILELFNVPVLSDDKFQTCKAGFKEMDQVIAESLDPSVVDDPTFVNPLTQVQGQVQAQAQAFQAAMPTIPTIPAIPAMPAIPAIPLTLKGGRRTKKTNKRSKRKSRKVKYRI
jgi:hypothetical protein